MCCFPEDRRSPRSLAEAGLHTPAPGAVSLVQSRLPAASTTFLDRFASRKRKALRKERRRVAEQGIEPCVMRGRHAS
jgi:hypothetical protein